MREPADELSVVQPPATPDTALDVAPGPAPTGAPSAVPSVAPTVVPRSRRAERLAAAPIPVPVPVGSEQTPFDRTGRAWARQAGGVEVDVAIVGAGGAGLSLVVALDRLLQGRPGPRIAIVDPVHRLANDRTWCFWDRGTSPVEDAVHRAWRRVAVVGPDGEQRTLDLGDLRYVMVRSAEFYALADDAAARLGAVRVPSPVEGVADGPEHASVLTDGLEIRARWVFDSRPAAPRLPGNTDLLQHFRGWTIRFGHDALDPDLPVLMDFAVPQPENAVAFGYVLPSDTRRGLVEYTQFSRTPLFPAEYDARLRDYLVERWGTGGQAGTYTVEEVEDGVIPMTDALFARRAGRRVMRLGTAGGATRPSTGYTFAAMQRQAEAVAAAIVDGRDPEPPPPHLRRHRWMDAVLLRAIDRGSVEGSRLLTRLFDRNPADRVLRFLDGQTSLAEDVQLMSSAPLLPMTGATMGDLAARVRRRAVSIAD